MKRFSVVAAFFCISLFVAGIAQAACVQGNLGGTWYFHSWSEKVGDPLHAGEWIYGVLNVGATGTVGASTATDSSGIKGAITGGQLKVTPGCEISGYINVLDEGVVKKQTIVHGALSRDRNSINMVGRNPKGRVFKIDCIRK